MLQTLNYKMIKTLTYKNIKGKDGLIDFSPLTLITGENMTGKTAVLTAIRIAALGYLPELGKRAGDITAIAGDYTAPFGVSLSFADGSTIARIWRPKPKGGYNAPAPVEGALPAVKSLLQAINWQAFMDAKPGERLNVLASIANPKMDDLAALIHPAPKKEAGAAEIMEAANDYLKKLAENASAYRAAKERAEGTVRQIAATIELPQRPSGDMGELQRKAGALESEIRELTPIADAIAAKGEADVAGVSATVGALENELASLKRRAAELRNVPRAKASTDLMEEIQPLQEWADANETMPWPHASDLLAVAIEQLRTAEAAAAAAVTEANRLDALKGSTTCPCCGQDWDLEAAKAAAWKKHGEAFEALAPIKAAVTDHQRERQANKTWGEQLATLAHLKSLIPASEAFEAAQTELEGLTLTLANASQEMEEAREKLDVAKRDQNLPSASRIAGARLSIEEKRLELATVQNSILALRQATDAWSAYQSQDGILKQAQETAEKAEKELEGNKETTTKIKAAIQTAVRDICAPLIQAADNIVRPVSGRGLAMDGDDIGLHNDEYGKVIPWALLSGTEQKLVTAALQLALGKGGIIFLDEMSDLDAKHRPLFIEAIAAEVNRGNLKQAVLIDHDQNHYDDQWTKITLH